MYLRLMMLLLLSLAVARSVPPTCDDIAAAAAADKIDVVHKLVFCSFLILVVIQGNGKTRSLLIGINYVGTEAELAGCHNDVKMMKAYIETHVSCRTNVYRSFASVSPRPAAPPVTPPPRAHAFVVSPSCHCLRFA